MAVTIIKLIRLPSNEILQPLKDAHIDLRNTLKSFTNNHFSYYRQIEDPQYLYALGTWASVKQHRGEVEKEEWALFSGWDKVDNHMGFAQTEGFKEYGGIRDWVDGFDVKHAQRLELREQDSLG